MESQTKQYQHCKFKFTIESEDFDFYQKIKVPAPTFCPFCRINKKFDQWVKNLRMIKRTCSECNIAFRTSYSE